MRMRQKRLFCLLLALTAFVGTMPTWCREQATKSAEKIGPGDVWVPPPGSLARLQQQCGIGEDSECLPTFMSQNEASSGAVRIGRQFNGHSFISEFKHMGLVSLATVTSPFMANSNDEPILVNGSPGLVDVSNESKSVDLTRDASYISLTKNFDYPFALSLASPPKFKRMRNSPLGGQQFVFVFTIKNGCQACSELAVAQIAFDFDRSGKYTGPKLLGITPAPQSRPLSADLGSSSEEKNRPISISRVTPDFLITNDSVGPVRIGMPTARVRQVLPEAQIARGSNGDGAFLYVVRQGTRVQMVLYPLLETPWTKVNESTPVRSIEVMDPSYRTARGVHPGMLLRGVEAIYGKLSQISMSEVESHEFAAFPKLPEGIGILVSGENKAAGIYARGEHTTTQYDPSARVLRITVVKLGGRPFRRKSKFQ